MNQRISKTVYKVSDFISWQRSNTLVLSPSFQRRSVWPQAAKSLLIDTVVRGIPMPIIFLREKTDLKSLEPVREVVDGQQRLRTLIAFVQPTLLSDFDKDKDMFTVKKSHNAEIGGKTFRNLEDDIRKEILNYDFSVHILPSDTDDRDVLKIFARMNSSGVKLNGQELRNAEYYGEFKQTSYTLAYEQLNRWRTWRVFTETDIARMIEVETISDLLGIMLNGIQSKTQPALNKLYGKYEEDFAYAAEATRRFHIVMDKIDETVGDHLSMLAFSRKALFETLFVFYYDLLFGLGTPLTGTKAKSLPPNTSAAVMRASDTIINEDLPENLARVLRGGTTNKESRITRLEFLREQANRVKA